MAKLTTRFNGEVSYFPINSMVEHSWFIGKVIGLNVPRLLQWVRVTSVKHPAPGREIGSIKAIPFNHGHEVHGKEHIE